MSCKDTIHLICWYLERKLSPSVESEIERHLSECRDCHLVFDAANTTLDRYFEPARQSEAEAATGVAYNFPLASILELATCRLCRLLARPFSFPPPWFLRRGTR